MAYKHLIEDCSTFTALIFFLAWFLFAIYGSATLMLRDATCFVKLGNAVPVSSIPETDSVSEYEDIALSTRYIGQLGLAVLGA